MPQLKHIVLFATASITVLFIIGGGIYFWQRATIQEEDNQALKETNSQLINTLPSAQKSEEFAVRTNPYKYEENSYQYGDIILTYEPDVDDQWHVTVYITQKGVKSKLIESVIRDIPSATYPQFKKTENPDIAFLDAGMGDAGVYVDENYYIVLSTRRVIKVFLTSGPLLTIHDSFYQDNMNDIKFLIENECGYEESYKGKRSLLKGISLNGKLGSNLSEPFQLSCLGPDGIGPIYKPHPDLSYLGITKDLSKIYFSLDIYSVTNDDWYGEREISKIYSFDINSRQIQEEPLPSLLYVVNEND